MNKGRRKAIAETLALIDEVKCRMDDILASVEAIRDEEQEYFDNMPESFQQGDKGQMAEAAAAYLEEAADAIGYLDFDSIMSALESAAS